MTLFEGVLLLLSVVALGGAALALLALSRARSHGAALHAERDAARADLSRTTESLAARERDLDQRTQQLQSTKESLAARDAELRAEKQARAEDEQTFQRLLDAERDAAARQREELDKRLTQAHEQAQAQIEDKFRSLAGAALTQTQDQFVKLAREVLGAQQQQATADLDTRRAQVEQLVKPIRETLDRAGLAIAEMEKSRATQTATLAEQVRQSAEASTLLRLEASKLTRALSKPEVRGRYGEIQLRRVAELAGMSAYCDFTEQATQTDAEGNLLRPDLEVRLPNGRVIAVDAKTNTRAYLEAVDAATPEAQSEALDRFARHVADQAAALGAKKYWRGYEGSPEFVVMFVPGDQFIDAALSRRPDLLDAAAQRGVILASPSTLIALLRAVAVGWRERQVQAQASELLELGRELHDRVSTFYAHARKVGRNLDQASAAFNDMVGSLDTRLTPTLRKFEDAGVKSAKELDPPVIVETRPRELPAPADGSRLLG